MGMRLYYSKNSPYARVARIAVLESSLADKVDHIMVVNRTRDNPLRDISPTCRVPTLVDGDLVLGETRHICAYLDHLQGRAQFFPAPPTDWQSVSTESVVLAFLDSVLAQFSEGRRPANAFSNKRIEWEQEKTERCLALFNEVIRTSPDQFRSWDYKCISLAVALDMMDFHSFQPDWRSTRIELANWFTSCSGQQSMIKTAPH